MIIIILYIQHISNSREILLCLQTRPNGQTNLTLWTNYIYDFPNQFLEIKSKLFEIKFK